MCNNVTKQYKNDWLWWSYNWKHDPNWSQIPDHPYRILIIGGSGCGKKKSLFNLIHSPTRYW